MPRLFGAAHDRAPDSGAATGPRRTLLVTRLAKPMIQGSIDSSAARSSPRTSLVSSSASRRAIAVRAATDAIRPSAQAACARMSQSSSSSACESSETSSFDPVLPSTTAAFRRNPRNLGRFIGDLRKASMYSDWVIESSDVASCRALTLAMKDLAASAVSRSSCANDTFHGHTSWGEWPGNRFEIDG